MFGPWLLFALIAVFMYGTSQTIVKIAFKDLSVPTMIVINFLITMPIYATLLLASSLQTDLSQAGLQIVSIGFLAALLGRTGYYVYLEALESGPVTIVGSITAAYPAVIAVLALTLLRESITSTQAIGVALVIIGIVALSYASNGHGNEKRLSRKAIIYCAATLAIWGIWGLFAKIALLNLSINSYLGLYTLALPIVLSGYIILKGIKIREALPRWSMPVKIAAISVMIGQIGLFADTMAVSIGNASIVFPMIAAYPIITILEAQTFLNETISRKEVPLIALVIIGILFVSTV